MMNSHSYLPILDRRVTQELEKIGPNAILQHVSAPCHKAKIVTKFFEENQIELLAWPGKALDLNPIENLWAIVKKRLTNRDCTTKTKLIEAVIQV